MWESNEENGCITKSLPSCLFKISKYTGNYLSYVNYRMSSNFLLKIRLYNTSDNLLEEVEIKFPETDKPLNINEWSELVNKMYKKTELNNVNYKNLSEVLTYNWDYYVYKLPYLNNELVKVNTVQILNYNKTSDLKIELLARSSLLQFFGKPFTIMEPSLMGFSDIGRMKMHNLQQLFTFAGSRTGAAVEPDLELFNIELEPTELYKGYIDGLLNDNLFNFAVEQEYSEKWIYINLDNQDAHPFHFHMTSAFVVKDLTSNCLDKNLDSLEYSKDTYAIPPQQKIEMYIKFPYRNSYEGQIKYLGYMYHCHFMTHHDMSMMGQFFIYPKNKHNKCIKCEKNNKN